MSDFRLKVFQSVARNLSFTQSAQELFISQPAVTKHIHELETQYGVALFERRGNRISLTEAGRVFLKHTERIVEDYRQLDFAMNSLCRQVAGELRLGASTTIAQYVLPVVLARFVERHPQVKVSLFNGNSREVIAALENHTIDLGLVEGRIHQPHLKYTHFLDDELVAVVSSKNPLAKVDEITLTDLLQIPLVLREQGSGTLEVIEAALERRNIHLSDLHVLLYLGSTESIKSFLQHSEGMGIVSIRSIQDELKSGILQVVEIEGMRMMRNLEYVQLQGCDHGLMQLFMEEGREPAHP